MARHFTRHSHLATVALIGHIPFAWLLLLQAEDEGEKGLSNAVLWQVAAEIAAGLAHLHSAGVLHLDVKPGNVFADSNGGLRLGDFGLAVLRHLWVHPLPALHICPCCPLSLCPMAPYNYQLDMSLLSSLEKLSSIT